MALDLPPLKVPSQTQAGPVIIYLPAQNMLEAAYNPRQLSTKQAYHLTESLLLFGFVDAVIVNAHPARQQVLVGGHQRRRLTMQIFAEGAQLLDKAGAYRIYPDGHPLAGQEINHPPGFVVEGCRLTDPDGLLMLPATTVYLDAVREKELNLRLNKNGGSFDKDILANLYELPDLLDVGFSEVELGLAEVGPPVALGGLGADDGDGSGGTQEAKVKKPRLVLTFETPEDAQACHPALQEVVDRLAAQPVTITVTGMGKPDAVGDDEADEEEEELDDDNNDPF